MSWIQNEEREGTAVDATLQTSSRSCEIFKYGGRVFASILSFAASIIVCGIVWSLRCISLEYLPI